MNTQILSGLVCALALALLAPCSLVTAQSATPSEDVLSNEEIASLVAPLALYPDDLVSQILMASTYPLEVVGAARWAEDNASLEGDALASALDKQTWDPSVKSLVNFPDVLKMMNDKLDWMTKLGDAFLAQQDDVLAEIQSLRGSARDAGNLESSDEQNIIVEGDTIIIESTDPDVIYVPTYDPVVVYGTWPYSAYPPYYYYPPGYRPGRPGLWFGAGFACGAAWGYAWGDCNWRGGDIRIDNSININRNPSISNTREFRDAAGNREWRHNAEHRRGAAYSNQRVAREHGRAGTHDATRAREQYRGRADQGRRDLAQGGSRGSAGAQRQTTRPSTTQRDRSNSQRSSNNSAFERSGSSQQTRQASQRGHSSRQSSASRSGGGRSHSGGGAQRGGGGGRRR